jgi:hypothetical protein
VGLAIGARAVGMKVRTVGISPNPHDNPTKNAELAATANSICNLLERALEFVAADFDSHGE